MYISMCKKCCNLTLQEKVKAARDRENKTKINPKYLVRGLISNNNRDCSISSEA